MSAAVWLYVIAEDVAPNEPVGPCKVGISSNPFCRMDALQTGCPSGQLYIVRAFGFASRAVAQSLESHFHRWRNFQRRHREWFDLSPDDAVRLVRHHIHNTLTNEGKGCAGRLEDRLEDVIWADTEDELTDLSEFA